MDHIRVCHSLQLDSSPRPLSKQLKQATAVLENATPILHGNSLSDKPRLDHTLLHKLIGRLRFIRLHTAQIHSRPAVEVTRTMLSSYRLISRRQTPDRRYILYRSHGCNHVVDDVLFSVLLRKYLESPINQYFLCEISGWCSHRYFYTNLDVQTTKTASDM